MKKKNLQPEILRRNRNRYNDKAAALRLLAQEVDEEVPFNNLISEAIMCEDLADDIDAILKQRGE